MAKEIGQLNVKIDLDSTGFQNGISSLNREMRKIQSGFRLASSEMGKHGKELDGLKLRSDCLTCVFCSLKLASRRWFKVLRGILSMVI
ncbi:MAG TPA: hypothetical protein VJ036_02355 [bacterium]|nr:hypothetical protein [bacterium]